jgi:hypothetical protein
VTAVEENVHSPLLPGGSLIAASLDRQVMIWSDRGGASRHIGDRWAVRCAAALVEAEGRKWPVPGDEPFELLRVLRLDDVPEVSREANLHQLENPDFLLIGYRGGHAAREPVLQAADAKFAADRIKPSQVSVEIVSNLLGVENGVTRQLVDSAFADLGMTPPRTVRGVFVCPASILTDFLLRRVTQGRNAAVDPREVVTVPPATDELFAELPMARLLGPLARIDALPVSPRNNLISAIYYFRLACACFYLWSEGAKPLLANRAPAEPPPGVVAAEAVSRAVAASSAYSLVDGWAMDVEPTVHARAAVANVASLPIRSRDIRARVEAAGRGEEPGYMRWLRRELELEFRARLLDLTGEIEADDPRPLPQILDDVAQATRSLRAAARMKLDELLAAPPRDA